MALIHLCPEPRHATLFVMQDSRTSPPSASRPFSVVPAPRQSLLAARHPGVRPPLDVRQTCVLMCVAAVGHLLVSYRAWTRLDAGVPAAVTTDLWLLLSLSVLVALGLVVSVFALRRAGHALWRLSRLGAVIAFGTALYALYQAAVLADTWLMLAGSGAALLSITVNIALLSTGIRSWCAR